jgi:hypothetical protein
MNNTWKYAVLTIVGLVAITTVGLSGTAESKGPVARNAAVGMVDCNIRDPFSKCFDTKFGTPAGDLLITEFPLQ